MSAPVIANVACLLFFFQAEDGIRDLIVTGVQTCALPIWFLRRIRCPGRRLIFEGAVSAAFALTRKLPSRRPLSSARMAVRTFVVLAGGNGVGDRKRVGEGKRGDLGGRRIIKKKKKKRTRV